MRIALATCEKYPQLDVRGEALALEALRARGAEAVPAVWNDPHVRWNSFDAVVIRTTWDYDSQRADFLRWTEDVPRLFNPASVIRWNTDKHYLLDLAGAGVATVPTTILEPGQRVQVPSDSEFVVKPTIGRGSSGAARFDGNSRESRRLASAHIRQFHEADRAVVVQPYQFGIEVYGETNLIYIDGQYSHAIRKGAILDRATNAVPSPHELRFASRTPLSAEYALADEACAALPRILGEDAEELLYVRVELVPGPGGLPLVSEVEAVDACLYFGLESSAPTRFAEAVVARCEGSGRVNGRATPAGDPEVATRVPTPRTPQGVDVPLGTS